MELFAQRVDSTGATQWQTNGVLVVSGNNPVLVDEPNGMPIVLYLAPSNPGYSRIAALRLTSTGAVDWQSDVSDSGSLPAGVADGEGGAIAAWVNAKGQAYDIYCTRLTGAGALSPGWQPGGTPVCTADGAQWNPAITTDGAGGALVAWEDNRDGAREVYVQRITGAGSPAPGWPSQGLRVGFSDVYNLNPKVVSDGANGAYVLWIEGETGTSWPALRLQHVLGNGSLAPGLPINGRNLLPAGAHVIAHHIAEDGSGGAYVAWTDDRNGAVDIYATRVSMTGTPVNGWLLTGNAVCVEPELRALFGLVSVPGGIAMTWHDNGGHTGISDVYGTLFTSAGVRQPGWPENGAVIGGGPLDQENPVLATSLTHLLFAWQESYSNGPPDLSARVIDLAAGVTGVEGSAPLPAVGRLDRARPNPLNPTTKIPYALVSAGRVSIRVYDAAGRLVRTLEDGHRPAGEHIAEWDGRADNGIGISSGAYFGRITFPDGSSAERKMTILR